ncbi:MAG TPA: EAL domain-containing protein [Xanthobacteraceae bacterium]|nr:EAL domain-containing protein [Xanthobacteraceae bacterium]
MVRKLKPQSVWPAAAEAQLAHPLDALARIRRDAILQAIALSAQELLRSSDLGASLCKVIEQVGLAAGADHLHILEIDAAKPIESGVVTRRYMWSAPGIATPEFRAIGTPMAELGLSTWIAKFSRGETVVGHARDFDSGACDFMRLNAIKSILGVPIFVEGLWWGVIGFDDCRDERDWPPAEIDIVKILAELVSAAVVSMRRLQELASSHVLLKAAIENSPDAILVVDQNRHVTAFNRRFAELWGVPRRLRTGHDNDALLRIAASRMKNEREFLDHAHRLYIHRNKQYFDEMETKDGRTIERRSAPLYDDDKRYLGRIWFLRDISRRKKAEQKIVELARTDPLTGLANRVAFLDRLHLAFARARRGGHAFAVLYLDLDRFKDVNDTLGHPAGDTLLKIVADRLRGCVRDTDLVARFGGDEFALLQEDITDNSGTKTLAAKICRTIEAAISINGNQIHTSASIGIVPYRGDLADPEAMLSKADLALYRAKNEGRGRFRFHIRDLDDEVRERVAITEGLHGAIERNELELFYQAQVELESARVVGLEALLRWNHPTFGLMAPEKFIPIAESSGSIIPIGQWVLEETCRQIAKWREQGIAPSVVSANLSAGQLKLAGNVDVVVADALAKNGIAASELELEMTETVLTEATHRRSEELARLRRIGVRIAIDDFGSGYSSLDYLRLFRVARLKIDRRFVAGVTSNSDDATIVRAVIGLAAELGIEVVAQGVETLEQRAFLISAGCRLGQGYYFGAPVPAAGATALLRAS